MVLILLNWEGSSSLKQFLGKENLWASTQDCRIVNASGPVHSAEYILMYVQVTVREFSRKIDLTLDFGTSV